MASGGAAAYLLRGPVSTTTIQAMEIVGVVDHGLWAMTVALNLGVDHVFRLCCRAAAIAPEPDVRRAA
jgi:hypothetical protein